MRANHPDAMFLTRCPFCTNANPQGSRYCNACGSPLHLRPCPHCEAVNDVAAQACHRCGAVLGFARDTEPPPVAAQLTRAGHAAELHELEVALARISVDGRAPATPLPAAAGAALSAQNAGTRAAEPRNDNRHERVESRVPPALDEDAADLTFSAQRAPPRSRTTLAGAIALVAVVAAGGYAWRAQRGFEAPAPPSRPAPEFVAPQAAPDAAGTSIAPSPAREAPSAASGSANDAPGGAPGVDSGAGTIPAREAAGPADDPRAEATGNAEDAPPVASPAARPPSPSAGVGANGAGGRFRTGPSAAAPKTKGASQDALATERVIRRALGGFSTPPKPPPPPR